MSQAAKTTVLFRKMRRGEEVAVSELAIRVFDSAVGPACGCEGARNFHLFASPAEIERRVRIGMAVLVAEDDGRLAGMLGLMMKERHISMLFVDPDHQGQGIARGLLARGLRLLRSAGHDPDRVTVNASPNALTFYERAGFRRIGPEMEQNGIRFTPMELKLRR